MKMREIIDAVSTFDGSLVVVPEEGGSSPEVAWGDAFFYYAPDGVMPERTQPYGTIITKDYPDDGDSRLGEDDRFRVNIHVGHDQAARLTTAASDPAEPDAFFPHPLYSAAGWVSVVNPGAKTADAVVSLLRDAHDAARARMARRSANR
ncbi:DUF6194 family protein [Micromonospora sp. DT81.3]|uniref:DUF6194 family protein n=1 Tax=Actinomycetes TaxID=1760 RepID=UPI003CF2DB5D